MNKKIYLCIIIGLLLLAGMYIFYYQAPYRVYNSDVFHQLAVLKSFSGTSLGNMGDPYFDKGPVDLHAGPYYYVLHLLSVLFSIPYYNIILFAAFANIILIVAALYFFARSFDVSKESALIFIIISLGGWGTFNFFFAGLYEFSNLLVTGSFPATLGFANILLIIGLSKRYLQFENNKLPYLICILSALLLLSHVLSGIILFSFLALLVLEDIFIKRKISRPTIYLSIAIIISIILSLFIWPPFNLITVISGSKTVQTGASEQVTENLFAVHYWKSLLGLTILGIIFLPYLIREKRYFIALLLVGSAFFTASYFLPVRITLYWRYFPFIYLALSLTLAIYIERINLNLKYLLLMSFIVIGYLNTKNKIDTILNKPATFIDDFALMSIHIPENAVLLSDPNTSYHMAALDKIKVVSVPYNHANPAYIPQSKTRYEETLALLKGDKSPAEQEDFIKKYDVEYVLINNDYLPDYIGLDADRTWLKTFELKVPHETIIKNDKLKIYKISND